MAETNGTLPGISLLCLGQHRPTVIPCRHGLRALQRPPVTHANRLPQGLCQGEPTCTPTNNTTPAPPRARRRRLWLACCWPGCRAWSSARAGNTVCKQRTRRASRSVNRKSPFDGVMPDTAPRRRPAISASIICHPLAVLPLYGLQSMSTHRIHARPQRGHQCEQVQGTGHPCSPCGCKWLTSSSRSGLQCGAGAGAAGPGAGRDGERGAGGGGRSAKGSRRPQAPAGSGRR